MFSRVQNPKVLEPLSIAAACAIYPLIVLRNVFLGSSQSKLGNIINDMNGTLYEVQSLKYMKFPWSHTLRSSFPDGETFWLVFRVVHGLIWILGWLLVQFFSPANTLGILILLGWTISGIGVYLVARTIDLSKWWSLCSAILAQMLPWFELKSGDHLFYVYMGIPLVVIVIGMRFVNNPTKRHFTIFQVSIGLTFFIDTYLFVFSLIGALVVLFDALNRAEFRSAIRRSFDHFNTSRAVRVRLVAILAMVTAFGVYCAVKLLTVFNTQSENFGEKARGVTSAEDVKKWTGTFRDLVTPIKNHWIVQGRNFDPGNTDIVTYGTLVALVLTCTALVVRSLRREVGGPWTIFLVSLTYIMIAIRTFSISGTEISASNILRFATPGIRVFARTAVLGQMLLVVIAVWFAERQLRRIRFAVVRRLCSVALVLMFVVDLSPNLRRELSNNQAWYSDFQQEVESSGLGGGVLLPSGRLEPFQLSLDGALDSLDIPYHNDLGKKWEEQVYLHGALGKTEFASYLLDESINFVVARIDNKGIPVVRGFIQDAVRINLVLSEPEFSVIRSQLTQDGQGVALVRVNRQDKQRRCGQCELAQFVTIPQLDHLGASGGGLVDNTFWSPSRQIQIVPEPLGDTSQSGLITVILELRSGDPSLTYDIRDFAGRKVLPEAAIGESQWFEFTVPSRSAVTVSANSECDERTLIDRPYCWGLGSFVAFQHEN